MGKVGSISIFKSLNQIYPKEKLHHLHILNDFELKKVVDKVNKNNRKILGTVKESIKVSRMIKLGYIPKYIITLTRDPIARNISHYFDFVYNGSKGPLNTRMIPFWINDFIQNWNHEFPLKWFDNEMKQTFNLDIYKHSFEKKKGFKIYKKNETNLLLYRLEDLSRVYSEGIKQLLGLNSKQLLSGNIKSDKTLYKQFIKKIRIPDNLLEKYYKSKYFENFYSDQDKARFLKKWCNKGI